MPILRAWTKRPESISAIIAPRSTRSRVYYSQETSTSKLRPQQASFPVVETCPSPTCQCRDTPSGLEIDRDKPLNGTMAAHAQHVLISTGRDDWKSRIEDEEEGMFVKTLKGKLGPKGRFSNPYHNVMFSNSSFVPPSPPKRSLSSALLLPSFQYVTDIPASEDFMDDFIKGFLLPTSLHPAYDSTPGKDQLHVDLTQDVGKQSSFTNVQSVNSILILICGHGGRDERCGVMGPLLRTEFLEKLDAEGIDRADSLPSPTSSVSESSTKASVGLISHIGGHKFAGNVIIYIPPSMHYHPLAGKGIWYGRVEPRHVEGIVKSTIRNGAVIKELFRGGIDSKGNILRI